MSYFDNEVLDLNVITDVRMERRRQDGKWGIQDHNFSDWMSILGEEYGEACHENNELHVLPVDIPEQDREVLEERLYTELKETAAVAVAAMAGLRRYQARRRE